MQTQTRVVLYGDSVVLAGLGHSLEGYPCIEVLSLDASGKDAPRELDALRPAALIVDLSVVSTDLAFSLLSDHPDRMLIGLDPGGDRLLVLSGQQARQMTTADLAHLIANAPPAGKSGRVIGSAGPVACPAEHFAWSADQAAPGRSEQSNLV